MAVKIRCRRTGTNNDPCFRVVAADVRSPQPGKFLEILGWYDPKKKEKNFHLNLERIEAWKKNGAQVSDMVKSLIRKARAGGMATAASPSPAAGKPDSSSATVRQLPDRDEEAEPASS